MPYHQHQLIIGAGGQMTHTALVQPIPQMGGEKRSSSLMTSSANGTTPGQGSSAAVQDTSKTPQAVSSQLFKLANGQLVQASASQVGGNQSMNGKFTPGNNQRALTPSQLNG